LIVPIFRSPHSAQHTARGVANGIFWGLTPTPGLQTIEIVATWFVAKKFLNRDSSLVQALVWVWVNNPLTMVPMYYGFYITGLWLTGTLSEAAGYASFTALFNAPDLSWLSRAANFARAVGVPALIGCVPYACLGSALSYRWANAVVDRRRHRLASKVPAEL
jgi:uncharacterized protein